MKTIEPLNFLKINLPGGIVSAGNLFAVLDIIKNIGIHDVSFGNRQQMLVQANDQQLKKIDLQLSKINLKLEINADDYPNIVSSYIADEVFSSPSWLTEGVYKDILDSFHYAPRLKVNIVDRMQNLVPFFTGNFNFISSEISNYWYLCVRFPKTNYLFHWPALIYTGDIAELCRIAEIIVMSEHHLFYNQNVANGDLLVKKVMHKIDITTQFYDQPLIHTDFQLPFYEGMNNYANQKFWLGIYRRNEVFKVDFLLELCKLCLDYRIGQLYTTPWKSILIKNIQQNDRKSWSILLNRYRINVRHTANELNWQLQDRCEEALSLKRTLVLAFEEADLRTSKLCFAIKMQKQTGLFGSIVIHKEVSPGNNLQYKVAYTKNFNPNTKEYIPYGTAADIKKLADILIDLCNFYYDTHSVYTSKQATDKHKNINEIETHQNNAIYQCKLCYTQYHPLYGDPLQDIAANTPFAELIDYHCFTCGAPKNQFALLNEADN